MNKKGFTLIELLAVIVILAIIALIATPIVLNIIEDSKKSTFVQTGNGIVDAAEYYYMKEMSDGAKPTEKKVFIFNGSTSGLEGLEFDGEIPKSGTITVDVNGKIELVAHNNQYCITKGYEDNEVSIKDYDGECALPICTLVNDADKNGLVTPGDKYQCRVKDNMEPGFENGYYFYVLSHNYDEEDSTKIVSTNLILDRNIYYNSDDDTGLTTEDKPSEVTWYGVVNTTTPNTSYGPVELMTYIYNATKTWNKVTNIEINYTDSTPEEQYGYTGIKTQGDITTILSKSGNVTAEYTNLKARAPYYYELAPYSEDLNNQYLYDNMRLTCYRGMGEYASCDEENVSYSGVIGDGISHIQNNFSYWTLSSRTNALSWYAYYTGGFPEDIYGRTNSEEGARPVITVKI